MPREMVVVDTRNSPFAKLHPVGINAVRLQDKFWKPRLTTVYEVTLTTQYELLEETGRIDNFRRASGKVSGDFRGIYFNDSDVYKWLEAVAFAIACEPNERLSKLADAVISEIIPAQDDDGYLNTYFTFERKRERWTDLHRMHELYCAGHLIQAAIAHHRATMDESLLNVAMRFADHIVSIFGPGKRDGTPGHPEIEMALVELYRETGNRNYLELAKFFLDRRGHGIIGGSAQLIDHQPFRELSEIVGHAVRSCYLNAGATDIVLETGERSLHNALERLWHNMTERKMYITGGIGARYLGEAFGNDYELPNERAYAETCAAIANVMWNWRMLLLTGDGRFADVMELALYNGVLSGISLDGKAYFYVNPLADRGAHRRQPWFPCACC
ncbi:MAG TPA: glycoside hydrolase family 127 protein, partial [Armatimonadetes bacterium]|nr:glycoside hydrolase family 127 protein [Armatimonadota bacterium]